MRTTTRTALFIGTTLAVPITAVGVSNALAGSAPAPVEPAAAPGAAPGSTPASRAAEAFNAAGYRYCDAVAIGETLSTEPWEAKVSLGARLLAGQEVDPPSGCTDDVAAASPDAAALDAFWEAGFLYCDAEALADQFGGGEPYPTKVAVGEAVLAGDEVPAPSGCVD